jgi:hypothetical protein
LKIKSFFTKLIYSVIGIFLFFYLIFSYLQSDYFYEHEKSINKFNHRIWSSANIHSLGDTSQGTPRRRMVNDLLRYHVKIGMNRDEIEKIIGTGEEKFDNNTRVFYYLGFPSFKFTFDVDVLEIVYVDNISTSIKVFNS